MENWQIPSKTARDLSLENGDLAHLKFGSLAAQVQITTGTAENFRTSEEVLHQLRLPEGLWLMLKREDGGVFRLGPIIGILTFARVIAQKDLDRYIPYALRCRSIGLLYVFGAKSINLESKTINGYYYNVNRHAWEEKEFPFPDVVMNRVYPTNAKAQQKLEIIIGPNKIFNKKTLINKIDFFKVLNKDSFLKNHIPETRVFRNTEDLEYMLKQNSKIFLKPVKGMKGKGIVQAAAGSRGLICRYMSKKGPQIQIIKEVSEIFEVLRCAGRRNGRYIIQPEIPRMEYGRRPFDFRVMTAKNGKGQWTAPAVFAKIAGSEGFLTNISSGGGIILLTDLIKGIGYKLPYTKTEFLALLCDLSVKTAGILDENFGPLGKLGLDIIIDNSGKPWLVEANGNPGLMPRTALLEYPHWRSQMYDLPLEYCLYLSGYSKLKNRKYISVEKY